jgi:hypothetical protein
VHVKVACEGLCGCAHLPRVAAYAATPTDHDSCYASPLPSRTQAPMVRTTRKWHLNYAKGDRMACVNAP